MFIANKSQPPIQSTKTIHFLFRAVEIVTKKNIYILVCNGSEVWRKDMILRWALSSHKSIHRTKHKHSRWKLFRWSNRTKSTTNYIKYRKLMHFSLFVRFFFGCIPQKKKKQHFFSRFYRTNTNTNTNTRNRGSSHYTSSNFDERTPSSVNTNRGTPPA